LQWLRGQPRLLSPSCASLSAQASSSDIFFHCCITILRSLASTSLRRYLQDNEGACAVSSCRLLFLRLKVICLHFSLHTIHHYAYSRASNLIKHGINHRIAHWVLGRRLLYTIRQRDSTRKLASTHCRLESCTFRPPSAQYVACAILLSPLFLEH